ncbi:MAG TPA: hypothetical protein VG965_04145 [Patescibacteria group bacterium]|nr:hypothetical protein [Patescibacteria group bacterium]
MSEGESIKPEQLQGSVHEEPRLVLFRRKKIPVPSVEPQVQGALNGNEESINQLLKFIDKSIPAHSPTREETKGKIIENLGKFNPDRGNSKLSYNEKLRNWIRMSARSDASNYNDKMQRRERRANRDSNLGGTA